MQLLTCQWTRYPYYLLLFGTKITMIYSILHWQIFMVSVRKIQTRMQTRTKFFNFVASYVFSQEEIQEIQDTSPRIPVTFGCNRSQIQSGSGFSLICWKRPRKCFEGFPLPRPMSCQLKNGLVLHQEWASCTGDWYTHELKTFRVELSQLTTR